MLLASAMLLRSWLFIRGVKRDARPVEERELLNTASEISAILGLKNKRVKLLRSRLVSSPLNFGIVDPIIVLPEGALRAFSSLELRTFLIHELAHVKRHDYAANLFQRLVQVFFFFHPLIILLNRRISEHATTGSLRSAISLKSTRQRSGGCSKPRYFPHARRWRWA